MPTYRFFQLDVFTDRPLTGNPLAVFPEATGLDDAQMQALAREMNLSETSFVFPSKRATRRLRFFTPNAEVPLPGHPTVGTWWLLATLGELGLPSDGTHQVTQETQVGVLPLDIHLQGGAPQLVVMTQAPPEFGTTVPDPSRLAELLGGGPDLIPTQPAPQIVSTGISQLMIPTASLAALEALPSGGKGGELAGYLRALGTDCAMCYALETRDPDATVHCRMFAPGLGVPEDPATGSASGALGAYLVRHGIVLPADGVARVVVEQGLEIGRPSRITVEVTCAPDAAITAVRVGGQAVTFIEGEVRL
ncbi:MAG: PhzF family phenazine biosynthesis protein [Gemmatimonadota bacterium]|nr:MAG: PhzF family phenazine biosynthesis protein [Gemmatimonadota bacterium]